MPIHPPLGFTPAFYSTEPEPVAAVSPIVTPVSSDEASTPSISYSREHYRSNFEFERHPDFVQFKAQFKQGFAKINEFCERHAMDDRAQLRKDFDIFLTRRFAREGNDQHFFNDKNLEPVDGPGKRAVDEMVTMLGDDKIDLQDKKAAVRELADGVTVCAPGVATNMVLASRHLSLATGALRAAVWRAKEAIFQAEVTQAARAEFGGDDLFANSEIHYYNAIRNYQGLDLGFPPIVDSFAPPLTMEFLERCKTQVKQALTPVNIAMHLAEECHAQFGQQLAQSSELAPDQESSPGVYLYDNKTTPHVVDAALSNARKQFGESLKLHSFVKVADNFERFHVLRQPTLVATDILEALDKEGLLKGLPTMAASWIDPERERATAYTADDKLLWLVRSHDERDQQKAWDATGLRGNANTERVLFDLPKALELDRHLRPFASTPSQATPHPLIGPAWRQAVLAADPAQLMQFPAASVGRAGTISLFLPRLIREQAIDYLTTHAAHFKSLRHDPQARAELADHALGALAEVPQVLQALYRDPWVLMNERPTEAGPSRLATAMHKNDVACVNALARCHEQLTEAGRTVAPKLDTDTIHATLVAADPNGTPALNLAMRRGNWEIIPAWGRILQRAAALEPIRDRLGELLAAKDAEGRPAVWMPAQSGKYWEIEAWGKLVLAAMPHIEDHLFELLAAKDARGVPAMRIAAECGNHLVIRAWGKLVLAPEALERIKHKLVELLAARDAEGTPAVWGAAGHDQDLAITEWGQLVLAALPHIQDHLFHLLAGKNANGTPAVSVAAQHGKAEAIRAWGKVVLALAREAPSHITNHLFELLAATNKSGAPGVWVAARSHNECFRAYLEVIEAAVPHLTGAQIKALMGPCIVHFKDTPPSDERLQTFLAVGARISDALAKGLAMSDVAASSMQGPSGPAENL